MGEPFNFTIEDIKLSQAEFDYFKIKIFELSGISLSEVKAPLVQSRLRSRVMSLGLKDFAGYRTYLETLGISDPEWQCFINMLTTNKTDWFREPEHFEYIKNIFLPKWLKLGRKELNVWCAASSTGEEPYTLAMVLEEALAGRGVSYKIHATDIDTKVLTVAKNGVYPVNVLHQIPETFRPGLAFGTGGISDWMKVRQELKGKVTFGQLNLTSSTYGMEEEYDLVMCRNVLIYFNQDTVQHVLKSLFATGRKESVLIVSHSESFQGIKNIWKYIRPSIYYKGSTLK